MSGRPAYVHKTRSYLHFDPAPSAKAAEQLVTSVARVASHPFYPFLGFTIVTPKIQRDENGEFLKKEKKRAIKLAAHMDAAIYAHYGRILAERYEADVERHGLGQAVIAFRTCGRARSNVWFANEAFDFIQSHRPCIALGLDIEKFFDRLDHAQLKRRWAQTLGLTRLPPDHFNIFRSLAAFQWVDRTRAFKALRISRHNPSSNGNRRSRLCSPSEFRSKIRGGGLIWRNPDFAKRRGIPQGAPISALLSNIYMLDFDAAMHSEVRACGGLYRRYCDDIMIVAPLAGASRLESLAMAKIQDLKLSINGAKTTRAQFATGDCVPALEGKRIQYLGFDFDGARKLIRASSLSRYYGKMRRGIKLAVATQTRTNKWLAAHGKPASGLKTRQLYIRYSYLIRRRFHGKRSGHDRQDENFITYAHRAAVTMSAPEIARQVRSHFPKLKAEIEKALAKVRPTE